MNCLLLPRISKPINNPILSENTTTISNPQQVTHIKKILKSEIGDSLTVAEMGGNIGKATIAEINDDEVVLTDIILNKPPPTKLDLTVILALPRPKVLRRLVMDMTALGVNKIILVNSYRTQKSYWQSPLLNRLDEFVFEGLQQAVDTVPPVIEFKKRFKPFIEDEFSALLFEENKLDKNKQDRKVQQELYRAVIAHPYASQSWSEYLAVKKGNAIDTSNMKPTQVMPKVICIGAEGGWIDYEVDLICKQGCTAVSLGERILRTEAVVNVLLGQWLTICGK